MKWIKALNLQQWADSIPAKVIFPALIADLIRATANSITEIRFPNGDKGQVRGYDGVLKAEGVAPYVPYVAKLLSFHYVTTSYKTF